MRKDAPLAVEVPAAGGDSPAWVKVGVIAAVGFVIGIAWPRVFNVRLGPTAPGEAASASASARAASRAPEAPPASVTAKTPAQPSASASAPAVASGPPQIHVPKGSVLSCKTDDGDSKKGRECGGTTSLDTLVTTRLKKLATCSAAEGQTGKLSFMVTADFASQRLNWDVGKSSTVGNIDGITGCLKTHFQGVSTAGVSHEHARYTVAYTATFAPPIEGALSKDKDKDKPEASEPSAKETKDAAKEPDKPDPAAGSEAAVGWEVALVRDVPKTGAVVARLPRGTKVKIGQVKDGWYAIKFGEGFGAEGWVYRGALGR
ncbi:MAG: hypothetical protein KF819_36090 [Labilithrix sp.]|nr:hypothetical protein [Labilithrix sp.]